LLPENGSAKARPQHPAIFPDPGEKINYMNTTRVFLPSSSPLFILFTAACIFFRFSTSSLSTLPHCFSGFYSREERNFCRSEVFFCVKSVILLRSALGAIKDVFCFYIFKKQVILFADNKCTIDHR
jgi:hypothetical protein